MQITKELVLKIEHLLSFGLTKGLGQPKEGQMCIEAAICYALGESHNDKPSCVGKEVREAKISLNDCVWSSTKARAEGMKQLAIAQLGSIDLDQAEFKEQLFLLSSQRILPYLIQKHYDKEKDEKLLVWIEKFKVVQSKNEFSVLWKEFYYYYNYYNYYYYYYYYDYYNYYYNYLGDEFLLLIADTILQVLKDMKSPGCEWLYLVTAK